MVLIDDYSAAKTTLLLRSRDPKEIIEAFKLFYVSWVTSQGFRTFRVRADVEDWRN